MAYLSLKSELLLYVTCRHNDLEDILKVKVKGKKKL